MFEPEPQDSGLQLPDSDEPTSCTGRRYSEPEEGVWRVDASFRTTSVNERMADVLGLAVADMLGRPMADFVFSEDLPDHSRRRAEQIRGHSATYEGRFRHADGSAVWCIVSATALTDPDGAFAGSVARLTDITEQARVQEENRLSLELLRVLRSSGDLHKLIADVVEFFRELSGCEAVGIRLKDGDDYPYFESRGFPPEFVRAENSLCTLDAANEPIRDSNGNPVLECMCGNIIYGRFDPRLPFFSEGGSFWSNCTTDLLATTTEEDRQAKTRNRCNGEGYESVALIPLRAGGGPLGLLQLNDKRKGRFTRQAIALFERLAQTLAVAVAHRLAEERHRKSEERYRTILQTATDGFTLMDTQGRLLEVNDSYCRMTGYSRDELLTMTISDLDVKETSAQTREHILQTVVKRADRFETVHRRKDGSTFDVEISASYLPIEGGRFVSFLRDITDRKRSGEALQAAKDFAENLIKTANALVVGLDVDGNVTLLNEAAQKVTGYTLAEVQGRNWFELIVPKDRYPQVWSEFARLRSGAIPKIFENPILTKSGEERHIAWQNSELLDRGVIAGTISFGLDLTDRKRSEEQLRASERFNNEIISGAAEGIVVYDHELRYVVWNRFMEQLTGVPADAVIGRCALDLFPHLREQGREELFRRAMAGETVIAPDAPFHVPQTGRTGWVSATYAPNRGAGGSIAGVIGMIRDTTDRKRAESLLRIERDLAFGIMSAERPREAYRRIIDAVMSVEGVDVAAVYLSRDDGSLFLAAHSGLSPEFIASESCYPADSPHMRFLEAGQSLFMSRPPDDCSGEALRREGIRGRGAIPVKLGDCLLASINVGSRSLDHFSADTRQALEAIAAHVGSVIQRERATDALRESEARLREAARGGNVGLWDWDLETNRVHYSPEWKSQIGYEDDEISNDYSEWQSRVHPEDLDRCLQVVRTFIEAGRPEYSIEFRLRHKDGSYRWILARGSLLHDEEGHPRRMLGSHVDITERKRAEETLQKHAEDLQKANSETKRALTQLQMVLDNAPIGICFHDRQGRYVNINRFLAGLNGVPVDQTIGRTLREVIPKIAPRVEPIFEAVQSTGQAVIDMELTGETEDKLGLKRYFLGSYYPLGAAGSDLGVGVIVREITERKKTEELLQERAAQLDLSQILVRDMDSRIVVWSRGLESLYGYTSAEATGRLSHELLQTRFSQPLSDIEAEVLRTGQWSGELIHTTRDGRELIVISHWVLQRDAAANPKYFVECVNDITALKQADQSLRESEHRYRTLVETAADAIFVADPHTGIILDANRKAEDLIGRTHDEIVGMHQSHLHPSAEIERYKSLFHAAVDGQSQRFHEVYVVHKDGHLVPVEINPGGLVKIDGRNIHFGIFRDISKRLEAEKHRRRLETAIEQAGDAIVITDPNGTIQYVNPAFERITGYTQPEAIGQNPRVLKSGEHDEAFYRDLWDTILAGRTWEGRFVNRRKDGTLYHEKATISPLRDSRMQIQGFVAVKQDVTREDQLEDQLIRIQKMDALGKMSAGIAHDFNNLLAIIRSQAESATSLDISDDERSELLAGIARAVDQASGITSSLLTFSREKPSRRKDVDLCRLVRETRVLIRHALPRRIRLEMDCRCGDPCLVRADPTQIQQVLLNLSLNARDAMPTGGILRIVVSVDDSPPVEEVTDSDIAANRSFVCLCVSDTGTGMSPEVQARIFEPFFTTKPRGAGTGLGLSIVHGIVKDHGGTIDVQSGLGEGTRFAIRFPLADPASGQQEAEPPVRAQGRGQVVLVAITDPYLRGIIMSSLRSAGYEAAPAADGDSALGALSGASDVKMAVVGSALAADIGIDRIAGLRKAGHDIPVIILAGCHQLDAAQLDEHILVLEEPFSINELMRLVDDALQGDKQEAGQT